MFNSNLILLHDCTMYFHLCYTNKELMLSGFVPCSFVILRFAKETGKNRCIDRKIKCPLFGFILCIQDLNKSCFLLYLASDSYKVLKYDCVYVTISTMYMTCAKCPFLVHRPACTSGSSRLQSQIFKKFKQNKPKSFV